MAQVGGCLLVPKECKGFVLDWLEIFTNCCRVVVQGPGPGPRYGHVMALVGQRFLLAIGGNDGKLLFPLVELFLCSLNPANCCAAWSVNTSYI